MPKSLAENLFCFSMFPALPSLAVLDIPNIQHRLKTFSIEYHPTASQYVVACCKDRNS